MKHFWKDWSVLLSACLEVDAVILWLARLPVQTVVCFQPSTEAERIIFATSSTLEVDFLEMGTRHFSEFYGNWLGGEWWGRKLATPPHDIIAWPRICEGQ